MLHHTQNARSNCHFLLSASSFLNTAVFCGTNFSAQSRPRGFCTIRRPVLITRLHVGVVCCDGERTSFVWLVLQDERGDLSNSRNPEVIKGHVSSHVEQLVNLKEVYQREIETVVAIDEGEVDPFILCAKLR